MHGTVHKPNATFLSSLYPGPRKEFLRAFAMARHDPLVVPVTRYADYTMPKTRAYRPRYHRHEQQEQQQQQQQQHALPSCGGVSAIAELDAPLFIASERARMLAVEKAPYGMLMGGKSKAEMIAKIRQYKRNASLPLSCRYASCAVVGSSGILRGGRLGAVIDAHDAVIRINAAPTHRHEEAVGRRTTWRIHNSEKPYMMAVSDLPELQVAICHMAWIGSCQHQAFSGAYDETLAYINPRFYSQVYSLLGRPRDKSAPSTGLLAIALALGVCDKVSVFGFGAAGAAATPDGAKLCRHYWECPQWENEAKYHDPLHTFHDWQAEEQLRRLWVRAGILVDGVKAFDGVGTAAAAARAAVDAVPPLNATAARRSWQALQKGFLRDLRALQRARDERRHQGIGPGEGTYAESTAEMLRRMRGGSGGGSSGGGSGGGKTKPRAKAKAKAKGLGGRGASTVGRGKNGVGRDKMNMARRHAPGHAPGPA